MNKCLSNPLPPEEYAQVEHQEWGSEQNSLPIRAIPSLIVYDLKILTDIFYEPVVL